MGKTYSPSLQLSVGRHVYFTRVNLEGRICPDVLLKCTQTELLLLLVVVVEFKVHYIELQSMYKQNLNFI